MGNNYYRRLAATGLAFAIFGVGGLMLSIVVFPTLYAINGQRQKLVARKIIHKSFRLFMRFMQLVGVIQWDVRGAERLQGCRNVVVLANHPTLIDVVALIALIPDASCVVKQALWRNPLLGGVVRAAGYISNDAPQQMIDACARDLAQGTPLIIFPEGTRTVPGEPLRFQRGASYILLDAARPVVPVLIDCTPSTLAKRQRWYEIPSRKVQLTLTVLEQQEPHSWIDTTQARPLAARRLTTALENYFTTQLESHGYAQA